MPFRGSRGSSRGRGSISGGFKGRGGGRGGRVGARGGSTPRGRGRGRGKPIFDSARLAQQKEEEHESESGSETPSDEEEDGASLEESSEDDDDEPAAPVRSYAALMQSLAVEAPHQSKRRKLQHSPEPRAIAEGASKAEVEFEEVEEAEPQEEEEGPETATEGLLEGEGDEEQEDSSDPFEAHFADPDDNILSLRLKAIQKNQWGAQRALLPKVGRAIFGLPQTESLPVVNPIVASGPETLRLKQKLSGVMRKQQPNFDPLERSIAPLLFAYQDVLFCARTAKNSGSLRRLACLHAINHIFKTRDHVIKNNARIAKEDGNEDVEYRDQGFTRPKVLMILPTRESCVKMVDMITTLCEPEQQENRKRFDDGFVIKGDKFSAEKAEDFKELFEGNDDDMFRLGLKFTRRTIKYFSQFYNSDIIFASPLGLRMALEGKEDAKGDSDFLSSIEIVVVDHADALLMQNWEHVEYIFEHLNLQPKEAHGCDFSRVRSWYLDDNSKYFRQTITLAAFNTPEINTLFFHQSKNWAGKVKINDNYAGALQELGFKVKQTFSRLESPSFATDPNARFTYFSTAIIPSLTRQSKDVSGTLIFIPSYLDFVRVRNYFSTSAATSNLSFGSISEYTSVQDVARARSHFLNGRHSVLLYTERAHHFRRYQLKGVRRVVMYGLPDNPIFYKEIVGGYLGRSMHEGKLEHGEGSARVIFSKWDLLKLERVAGTERVGKMIKDKGDTFDFL